MLQRLVVIILVLFASLSGFASGQGGFGKRGPKYLFTGFREPATEGLRLLSSTDGLHWDSIPGISLRPEVGSQHIMRDPGILQTPDGVFHLVWTTAWRGDRGFGYASSRDLTHWSKEQFIPVMTDTSTVNVWAPELFYDDLRHETMIVWASCIPGKFPDGQEDHKNNHRLYYTATRDFETFTPVRLFYDPGFSVIDAMIVKKGDHDYVMVFKDNTRPERDLRVAFARDPRGPWSKPSAPITEKLTEGPTVARLADGSYIIYYDRYGKGDFGALRTRDFKHFEDYSSKVRVPKGHKHGTIIYPVDNKELLTIPHYSGSTMANPDLHDGALSPIVGVHNIQILHANREHPSAANGGGWTYNHQPMMAYWHGRFYVHYLSDPSDEHIPPSHTNLQTSEDGYHWSAPRVLFPEYPVPDGYQKPGHPAAHNLTAVMHQRVGWYVSKEGRLYALGNYGVCLDPKDDPNDGNGIGRVIREVKSDGSFGPIYFIYYNHAFNAGNTRYPYYTHADKHLRKAAEEILANPRYRMQWVEEADRGDSIIPLNKEYKAYCDYTLPDGRLTAFWKHALTSVSTDGGYTWLQPVNRAFGFVNSNAKIWGQRLSDGSYATVYNPSEFRWPLAISLSGDGLDYKTLNLVCGEVPPMRYGGNYKSRGPQYVRGILEGNGVPKDSDLWVSWSMNKEDIWVSHIPVPVRTVALTQAADDFSQYHHLSDLTSWNLYMPLLAPIQLDGTGLTLHDHDRYDYAVAERKVPATKDLELNFTLIPHQADHGTMQIEFLDDKGIACSRIDVKADSSVMVKTGARFSRLGRYAAGDTLNIHVRLDAPHRMAYYRLTKGANDGPVEWTKKDRRIFMAPVAAVERIRFRTGERRRMPNIDTPADWYGILPEAGDTVSDASWTIVRMETRSLDADSALALLHSDDYKHYAEAFGQSDTAWTWMRENIPFFDCPDKQMEEIYYFRWWSLFKHIESTPVGYGMTEFLVPRSYADKYNLISSALGHHIHESRWLRNPKWLDGIINTWYHGNDGQRMSKLTFYSQWAAASIWDRYLVDGRKQWVTSLLPALVSENRWWDNHRWVKDGRYDLYWQTDVRDAMEETISGGRHTKNARPSINSYMYGNDRAISNIAALAAQTAPKVRADSLKLLSDEYRLKADTLRQLVLTKLWNDSARFFEVLHPDGTSANVREETGSLPWYFGLTQGFDRNKTVAVWNQLSDPEGFCAPFGITTAERRHPLFRSHGTGTCEWDGAVWPFATSQTLTALEHYCHSGEASDTMANVFFREMKKYAASQYFHGLPYIGEYLDETTGYWLMGDRERSRYYNHSTFADLVITGLCGLQPCEDDKIVVKPLVPKGTWRWFCLDGVRYHGKNLTIVYDEDGSHYHVGKGLQVIERSPKGANMISPR